MRRFIVLFAASAALAACTTTYHPEYHPVTVSHYSQSVSYPVVSPASTLPSVTMYAPPLPAPPTRVPEEWPSGD